MSGRLRRRERQQLAVAEVSLRALTESDRAALLGCVVETAAQGLAVEYASVLELQPDGRTMLLRAGFGWNESIERVLGASSPAAQALRAGESVLVVHQGDGEADIRGEFLTRHGVASSAATVIRGETKPYGVLAVHSGRRRAFDDKDLFFLRSLANVVAAAIVRERSAESARQLALIVESSFDAIVGRTPDGIVTSWNEAAERLFGYSAAEMIGRSITILAPPERSDELDTINERLRAGETVGQFETVRVRKDGRRIEVASTVSPIRDASGRITAASAISRDIGERKRAEEALTRGEARLAEAQQIAHVGSWEWDAAADSVSWSDELRRICGLASRSVVLTRDRFLEIVHADERAHVESVFSRASEMGEPFALEHRIVLPDGRVRWVHHRGEATMGGDAPIGMRGTVQDVTERREAEEKLRQAELRYRTLIEQLPLVTYIGSLDVASSKLYASPQIEQLLGYPAEEWQTNPDLLSAIVHPDDRERVLAAAAWVRQTGEPFRDEYRCITPDGRVVWVQDETYLVHDERGESCVQGYLLDISERKLAEAQLRQSEERYRDLFENANEPIATVDLDWNLTRVNAAFERALGYTREELLGSNLNQHLTDEGREQSAVHRQRKLSGQERASNYEQVFVTKDGRKVTFEVSTRLIEEEGRPIGVQGICRDITARKENEAELRHLAELNLHQALHDQLTGLANRAHLQERIDEALADSGAGGEGFALMVIDVDRFKEINDSLGHRSGDLLLRQVADRLRETVRAPDTVARLGGDEFGILLPGLSQTQPGWARRIEQIKTTVEQPVFVQGIPVAVEASIGIVFHPEHGDTVELLLQHADVAMYVAKQEHRGHAIYNAREDSNDANRLALLGQLRRAIDNRELFLEYQPTIDLHTGNIERVEALVRWRHPSRGVILPVQFIPTAERTALIKPLTRYVLEHAVRQCKQWEREGHTLAVAVNLSTRNLSEPDLVDDVARTLDKWQLEPQRLLLEITESAIMSDPVRTEGVLRTLSGLGIKLAIDDFGAGYTSLAYLANLPLDQIKIDRSFIAGILDDEHDMAIVHAIVHLCNDLRLQVVAEGVESDATLDELRKLNCDIAQSYQLSKPLAPEQLTDWLDRHLQLPGKAA